MPLFITFARRSGPRPAWAAFHALLLALTLFCAISAPARAGDKPSAEELGIDENALARKVRQGRLSQDEIVAAGRKLSYFTRLKLYYYSRALEPYFLGLEDSFRDLARADRDDAGAVAAGRQRVADMMALCRKRLMKSGRDDPEADWRRGLLGLIWLDQQWRGRVYEQGKDEIKNPYDLVALVDCLDAALRGLAQAPAGGCPARAEKSEQE